MKRERERYYGCTCEVTVSIFGTLQVRQTLSFSIRARVNLGCLDCAVWYMAIAAPLYYNYQSPERDVD
ncbi:hypothetical protein BDW69DRAFT_106536 [Aspergillus filifer]